MLADIVTSLFTNTSSLLSTVFVPGLPGVTFMSLYIAIFGVGICCALLTLWLGIGVRQKFRDEWRGGNNRNMKISEERKGDTR